jgi:hypothetical protein
MHCTLLKSWRGVVGVGDRRIVPCLPFRKETAKGWDTALNRKLVVRGGLELLRRHGVLFRTPIGLQNLLA